MPHDHHPHDHAHHGHGHNHAHGGHLHSHMHHEDEAADLQVLATQFIEGFLQASDKTSYLKLAGVPFERPSKDGDKALKLIDVELKTDWQVGTASPSFGSRELSYLPFPGAAAQLPDRLGQRKHGTGVAGVAVGQHAAVRIEG